MEDGQHATYDKLAKLAKQESTLDIVKCMARLNTLSLQVSEDPEKKAILAEHYENIYSLILRHAKLHGKLVVKKQDNMPPFNGQKCGQTKPFRGVIYLNDRNQLDNNIQRIVCLYCRDYV